MLQFNRASKKSAKLRLALIGPAGAGKTYSALAVASHLEGPVAVVDTERGSASKYSDSFEFDVLELESHSPQTYIEAIQAAEEAGYKTLIIDSLSHAWTGKEGALSQVDRLARRSQTGNTFGAWRDVTPMHNAMVEAIVSARMNIIATMRAKTEYVQEKNEKTGKTTVRKIGLAPVQRDGLEYEFDVVADLDQDNNCIIGKTRCPALAGQVFPKAGRDLARQLNAWLSDGTTGPVGENQNRPAVRPEFAAAIAEPAKPAKAEAPKAPAKSAPSGEIVPGTNYDDVFGDDDLPVLCKCGLEAKFVRGKSGAGWVCGNEDAATACDFRQRESVAAAA
ncbi:MAG TPA: ATP-binding protein [Abditibacteriaceae bacterium]|jgi:hypothetical protein